MYWALKIIIATLFLLPVVAIVMDLYHVASSRKFVFMAVDRSLSAENKFIFALWLLYRSVVIFVVAWILFHLVK